MKTAFYVRVSTYDQNPALQRNELEAWALSQGIEPEWYEDQFTGATMDRPGMNRLLVDCEAGRISRIVVWRLDRLGRTLLGVAQLFKQLNAWGVEFRSLTEGLDLTTPTGRLLAQILAGFAEFERETIKDRCKAGIAVAKKAGKYRGRKRGSTKLPAQVIARIRAQRDGGFSLREIAKCHGISAQTVATYCREYKTVSDNPGNITQNSQVAAVDGV